VDPWSTVVEAEPDPQVVAGVELDDVLAAFADFTDIKSPWLRGHSRSVAVLASAAATAGGLRDREIVYVRRLGLVHDLGMVGVPAGVVDRRGPLSSEAWERVRVHTYLSERILSRCAGLASLASDAGSHHERIDGSGYHRGAQTMSLPAQIVGAADVYVALCAERPYRPKVTVAEAIAVLTEEVNNGRLGRSAVEAVLLAAGHRPPTLNVGRPKGLTEREVDVLRLIARGRSNKEAARDLGISTKTVGTHVEHIYAKANVTTRAGVTLFAMEHDLLAG
jgi:HD-GYP domain-containing protein (c-di-GMP phosphodiesterase class II)